MKRNNEEVRHFGENDFVSNRDEIFSLGLHNPIIHSCLMYYKNGDLSYEQAMMSAVKFLELQNRNMFNKLVEITMKEVKNEENL